MGILVQVLLSKLQHENCIGCPSLSEPHFSGQSLKCRTYAGTSKTDNGQETECTTGLDACLYSSVEANGVQTTTRSCIKAPNGKAECVDVGTGDAAYKQCYCMTDNCNMDEKCTCSSDSGASSIVSFSIFTLVGAWLLQGNL